jgi:hypothetical protein
MKLVEVESLGIAMPIEIACPNGHQLRVAEKFAGKRVRCPRCQVILEVPAVIEESELVESNGQEDVEREKEAERKAEKRRRRARNERLQKVRLGITLHLIKMLLQLASIVAVIALIGIGVASKSEHTGHIANLTAGGVAIVAAVLGLTGSVLCIAVPRASDARTMIVISLGLDIAVSALNVVDLIITLPPIPEIALGVVGGLLQTGSWLTFMFFLKRLADYLRERYLSADTESVLKLGLMLWLARVTLPIGIAFLAVIPCLGALIGLGLAIALLVAAVIFVIRYIKLLSDFRAAID